MKTTNKIYIKALKAMNWVLTVLLACMGFSGCETTEEYGTPHSDFTVKGKVTNEKGEVVSNIRVSTIYNNKRNDPYARDTTYTDSNGNYGIKLNASGVKHVQVLAEDIDGELNGALQADSTQFDDSEINLKGGGKGWYEGKGEKTVDFTLKEKEKE